MFDWTEQPQFAVDLIELIAPVRARLFPGAIWMPRGYRKPEEARLESFGRRFLPQSGAWKSLQEWWLANKRGANTPNWDIAVGCDVEGSPGLVLVEAKAHAAELGTAGKRLASPGSSASRANHEQIASAISEARTGLRRFDFRVGICRDTHYQLSNRLAFSWKLATLGVPTVLVYLGFLCDSGIDDVGPPLVDPEHWRAVFFQHAGPVAPAGLFGRRLDCGAAPAWFLVKSRQVREISRKNHQSADSLLVGPTGVG